MSTSSITLASMLENTSMLSHEVTLKDEVLTSMAISLKRLADGLDEILERTNED